MSARQIRRLPVLIVTFGALAALLSGCIGIKPGTFKLTQPAGIGPVNLQVTLCTSAAKPVAEGEIPVLSCGPVSEPGQAQMLVTLMVPVGSATPGSFNAVPGPGAVATTFVRSPELTAQMNATELREGTVGPPPGFEFAGYVSGVVSESTTQELTWTIEAGIGLPPGAGGGSYGGPLKAALIFGTRAVTAGRPASRPINCKELESEGTLCGGFEPNGEATLGISDLKVRAPAPVSAVPGAKVKVPFVLDFASSAAEVPKFKLGLASSLPGAELSLSNSTFTRGPSEPATRRAPPTTRTAIVQVPETAGFGRYELTFTATAAQGGAASAVTTISVKPKGSAKVSVPRRVKEKVAWSRGIPVKLIAPIAGTRFLTVLKGPRPSGGGSLRLLRRVRTARELGRIDLRMHIPRIQAEAFLEAGATLRLETRIQQPGTVKPKRVVSTLKLR